MVVELSVRGKAQPLAGEWGLLVGERVLSGIRIIGRELYLCGSFALKKLPVEIMLVFRSSVSDEDNGVFILEYQ